MVLNLLPIVSIIQILFNFLLQAISFLVLVALVVPLVSQVFYFLLYGHSVIGCLDSKEIYLYVHALLNLKTYKVFN